MSRPHPLWSGLINQSLRRLLCPAARKGASFEELRESLKAVPDKVGQGPQASPPSVPNGLTLRTSTTGNSQPRKDPVQPNKKSLVDSNPNKQKAWSFP